MNVPRVILWGAAVLAATFFFSACEDNPTDTGNPDTTGVAFTGTWLRESMTFNGAHQFSPQTMTFRNDSTATMTLMVEDQVETWNLEWWVDGDSMFVQPQGAELMGLRITHDGDNVVHLAYEANGGHYVDTFVRWSGTTNSQIVGDWDEEGLTRDGEQLTPTALRVIFENNGTGMMRLSGAELNFTWCVQGSRLLSLRPDHLGYVGTWSRSGDNLIVGQYREDGFYTQTLAPHQAATGLDSRLFGSWVLETFTIEDRQQDMQGLVVFNDDGSGVSHMYVEGEDPEDYDFTWTSSNDTLFYYPAEFPDTFYVDLYTIDGARLEIDGTFDGSDVFEVFWKDNGTIETDLVGRWLQRQPYEEEGSIEMSTVSDLSADGYCTLYEMRYEQQFGGEWVQRESVTTYTWSVSEDRLLVRYQDMPIGFVVRFTQNGHVATFDIPWTGEREFVRMTADHPQDGLGSWVMADVYVMGYPQPVDGNESILYEDGTAVTLSYQREDDVWGVVTDSLLWSMNGSLYLSWSVLNHRGDVVSVTMNGDVMQFQRYDFFGGDTGVIEMNGTSVRDSGTRDAAVAGTWSKTGETVNGVENPNFDAATLNLNNDGTGSHVSIDDNTPFTWNTNAGYVLVRMIEDSTTLPGVAMAYTLEGNTLRITMYERSDDNPYADTRVETYERQ